MLKNYIYITPQGLIHTIKASSIDELQIFLGDNPLYDRHGIIYEPEMTAGPMTSYRKITLEDRIAQEQERNNNGGQM